MPKLKTNKAVLKRFKITATGKILHKKAGRSHLLSTKSAKRRMHLRRPGQLGGRDARIIRGILQEG